jgi:hypothetical protein
MQAQDVAEQKQNRSSHSETRTALASGRHAITARCNMFRPTVDHNQEISKEKNSSKTRSVNVLAALQHIVTAAQ